MNKGKQPNATCIISKNVRIRYPNSFRVGEYSIIDDFCYFSSAIKVGRCSHIASGCSIAGGPLEDFQLGDYCSLSSGVKIWCASDDFVNDLVTIIPPFVKKQIKENFITGGVEIHDYCAIGSNAVIMPRNSIPQGVSIGALSFVPVNFQFEAWSVYAGNPLRFIKQRNKGSVLKQALKLTESLESE